jgi:P22 coat protein - gene protein 5
MSNSILTISMITRESMRVLENNLKFTKGVNRQFDDKFGVEGAKIGSTLNIRLPARYVGRSGPVLSVENQTETYVPLTLSQQFGVDVQFTSADLELSMDDFSERYLAPAMAAVANKIDRDGMAQALNVYQTVGVPGTTPAALSTYLAASAKLKFAAAPEDNLRSIVIDPNAEASIVNNLTTLFNPSQEISDQYKDGSMGRAIGFKWNADQNVNSYTTGPQGGSPQVAAVPASGASSISTQGWTASAAVRLNVGDIFTMAGVYAVNPQSRATTGQLQQFVVTSQFSSSGSGTGTVSFAPAIVSSGQFQNVTALPAVNAAITVLDAAGNPGNTVSPMNLAFHRDAFVLGTADLPLPKGVDMASRVSDKKVGVSIRMVRAYDIVNDMFPCRLDVLYGWSTVYPQLAVRIQG